MNVQQQFASDNYSGICPEAMEGLSEANHGHQPSYGDDPWTRKACNLFREIFEAPCEVFFVFNGTAANALALASLCNSYQSIICHELAHVETDECGAPEFCSHGAKLLLGHGEQGKLSPDSITALVQKRTDIHYPPPKVASISQATEVGTVYRSQEIAAIAERVRSHSLKLHMDGARFANALVELDKSPAEISVRAGVDVLCLGGTKNGMAFGEAVIFFNQDAARDFAYRCKQAGQLASKMRFIAAQWLGVLRDGAWLRHARHANAMAAKLESKLRGIPGVEILYPRQANSVFLSLPKQAREKLHARGWNFYSFIGTGGARLMTSWDTSEEVINKFAQDLLEILTFQQAPGRTSSQF